MSAEAITVRRFIGSPFVLDTAKLSRSLNIIEQRFTEARLPYQPTFEVRLADGKKFTLLSYDALVGLDNTIRNPIRSLSIEVSSWKNEEGIRCSLSYDDYPLTGITLRVSSSEPKLANQLSAELEEQAERTVSSSFVHKYVKSEPFSYILSYIGLLGIIVVASIILVALLPESTGESVVLTLSPQDVSELSQQSQRSRTLEEKVNFLFEVQS